MKIKLLTIALCVSLCTFGQSQVKLRSGETVEGNIKSFVNGVLTVTFKGNVLTFKQADISAIFFVKPEPETKVLTQTTTATPTPPTSTKAELKGVVTYYFNRNYGDKPDVGARIYLRKIDTTNGQRSVIYKYERARTCRALIEYKTQIESCTKTLKELNADTKEGFEKLNKDVVAELVALDYGKDVMKVTADGSGNYSVNVEPGLYEIIFVSKGRTDLTMAEIMGKIDTEIYQLTAGEHKIIDKRFDL